MPNTFLKRPGHFLWRILYLWTVSPSYDLSYHVQLWDKWDKFSLRVLWRFRSRIKVLHQEHLRRLWCFLLNNTLLWRKPKLFHLMFVYIYFICFDNIRIHRACQHLVILFRLLYVHITLQHPRLIADFFVLALYMTIPLRLKLTFNLLTVLNFIDQFIIFLFSMKPVFLFLFIFVFFDLR
jgi:hypothetical protein